MCSEGLYVDFNLTKSYGYVIVKAPLIVSFLIVCICQGEADAMYYKL